MEQLANENSPMARRLAEFLAQHRQDFWNAVAVLIAVFGISLQHNDAALARRDARENQSQQSEAQSQQEESMRRIEEAVREIVNELRELRQGDPCWCDSGKRVADCHGKPPTPERPEPHP